MSGERAIPGPSIHEIGADVAAEGAVHRLGPAIRELDEARGWYREAGQDDKANKANALYSQLQALREQIRELYQA